jgi:hypothetical protein
MNSALGSGDGHSLVEFYDICAVCGNGYWGRAKHIKSSPRFNCNDDKLAKKQEVLYPNKDESCERILNKVRSIL